MSDLELEPRVVSGDEVGIAMIHVAQLVVEHLTLAKVVADAGGDHF